MKIAILGAGAFGTALGGILAGNGYDIDYYDSRIEKERLSDVVAGSKFILIVVPSASISHVLPYLPTDVPLIIATKGILSAKTFEKFKDYMVLSGPGFAVDIKAQKKTYLTATDLRVEELFKADYLIFDSTDDENGVLMCGALKNVYAIYAGLLGLEKESDKWNSYIDSILNEMRAVLKENGAREETVDLACGVGDLKLTCAYPSRNYEFGDKLRHNPNYQPEKTVEGISALKRIKRGEIKVPKDATVLRELMRISEKWA